MKSLQLHGRRQIAEPRKYCLVHLIAFFGMCFLYFLFLIGWDFGLIPFISSLNQRNLLKDMNKVRRSAERYGVLVLQQVGKAQKMKDGANL